MSSDSNHAISLLAPPEDVDAVHALLERVWSDFPWVNASDRARFETALIELVSNVIRHAGGGSAVQCDVTVRLVEGHLEARLTDTGIPATIDLAAQEMPDDLSEGGRGIPLIRALVDELEYHRDGSLNRWRISRALGEADGS